MEMKFLLLNQTFYPDVMATGQYLTEVALELVKRGHQVTVVASRRSYDAPQHKFSKKEVWRGIQIIRVSSTGFGKGAKWKRCADFSSFFGSCAAQLSSLPKPDIVVALTSPPLIALLGAGFARWHRSRFVHWLMDLNPDEAIAVGWLKPFSPPAKLLEWVSRLCLKRADKIIALDSFMQARILAKGVSRSRVVALPLWSQELRFDAAGRQRLRALHRIEKRFVVMYSGNHSPCHPLDSLVMAAARLVEDREIVFCFVGGGSEFRKLQQGTTRPNILCLPYQPLDQLSNSLSAADLHVVIMGDRFVGIVHPCKVYNLLNLGRPILYIGPEPSPVTQLLAAAGHKEQSRGTRRLPPFPAKAGRPGSELGCPPWFQARHGEVDRIVDHIREARRAWDPELPRPFLRETKQFSGDVIRPKVVAQFEIPCGSRPEPSPFAASRPTEVRSWQ
jgi:colanic acid biosynthesis glycosyl transferase WcaI